MAAPQSVKDDLLKTKGKGMAAFVELLPERIASKAVKVKFYNTQHQQLLATFTAMSSKVKVKTSQKGSSSSRCYYLFGRLCFLAQRKELPFAWAISLVIGDTCSANDEDSEIQVDALTGINCGHVGPLSL